MQNTYVSPGAASQAAMLWEQVWSWWAAGSLVQSMHAHHINGRH